MPESIRGIKNRNVSTEATFPTQWLTFFVPKLSPLLPAEIDPLKTTSTVTFLWKAPWACKVTNAQVGINQIAAGMTTCTIDVRSPTASLLESTISMLNKSQQVFEGTVATANSLTKGQLLTISVTCTNNESAHGLSVSVGIRPLVGQETRT